MKTAMNRRAAYALLAGAAGVFNTHSFAGAVDGRGLNSFNSSLAPFLVPANGNVVLAAASPTNLLNVGVCGVYSSSTAPNDTPYNDGPVFVAASALNRILGKKMLNLDKPVKADVSLVSHPKHGKLVINRFPDGGVTTDYRSDIGYIGKETFSLLVKIEGQPPVKLVYFFTIVQGGPDDKQIVQYCGTKKLKLWQISESDFNSGSQDLAAWQRASQLSSLKRGQARIKHS